MSNRSSINSIPVVVIDTNSAILLVVHCLYAMNSSTLISLSKSLSLSSSSSLLKNTHFKVVMILLMPWQLSHLCTMHLYDSLSQTIISISEW